MQRTKNLILGGGLAGASLAYFLGSESVVLEKEATLGGLCRSFTFAGASFDIGPHILFSKNKEILDLHTSLVPTQRLRRSSHVFYKGRVVKYPFENDLSALPSEDRDYCLAEFLDNPYERYRPTNMLQFFLATFGEGITRRYLQPYNEKIWKFDPSAMDLQMVERIPKPPKEDVIRSANGIATDGYLHQLYFHYPVSGGVQSLVEAYARHAAHKATFHTAAPVQAIERLPGSGGPHWRVRTPGGEFEGQRLISTLPLQTLGKLVELPDDVRASLDGLLYNSIHIVMVHADRAAFDDRFAYYIPDQETLFHRVCRLNFLGEAYSPKPSGVVLQAEVTFRPGSHLSQMPPEEVERRTVADLGRLGLVALGEVRAVKVFTFPFAYVIYDLLHRQNVDRVLAHLRSQGILCLGRFGEFEYLNTDQVAERAQRLARELDGEGAPSKEVGQS